jgi:hypothetical protein
MMAWYAAHLILYFRSKKAAQKRFLLWENIVLIKAASEEEAYAKAEARGRQSASSDPTIRVHDQPAELVFAGVRKLVLCEDQDKRPADGTEISYTEMEVHSEEAIRKLIGGEPVAVTIVDQFPDEELPTDGGELRRLAGRCN